MTSAVRGITTTFSRLALTALLLISAACTLAPQENRATREEPGRTFAYDCDCIDAVIKYAPGETAWLFVTGGSARLVHTTSAAGSKYVGQGYSFWVEEDHAILETPEEIYPDCRLDRAASPWEDAKLRGVDFRAVGNEPGWVLEIDSHGIYFELDYGQQRMQFPPSPPEQIPDLLMTSYQSRDKHHILKVRLEGRRCQDSMADQEFETRVTVDLDNRTYHGCGRPLH